MTQSITIEKFIPQPKQKVWDALTRPEQLAAWWAEGDIAPTVGHKFTLDMDKFGHVPCEVLEVEPGERFVYTFDDWTLTWRLEEAEGGTHLYFEQSGFDLDNPKHKMAYENMSKGWEAVLSRLARLVTA